MICQWVFGSFFLGLISFFAHGQTLEAEVRTVNGLPVYTVPVETIHHPDRPGAAYWQVLRHLTADGKRIYAVGLTDPIYMLDADGSVIETVGGRGKGPGEYGLVFGLHARDGRLWALSDGHLKRYRDGRFEAQHRLRAHDSLLYFARSASGDNTFEVANNRIVLPFGEAPKRGQIGSVYDLEGRFLQAVEDPEFDGSVLDLSPWAQKTMWQYHDGLWFCAYMYLPRLAIFDEDFRYQGAVTFDSPVIQEHLSEHLYNPRRERRRKNLGLFLQFQIFEGDAFLSAQRALHRIDPTTGEVRSLIEFKPTGPEAYEDLDDPTPRRYAMPFFVILEDRRIVVGNSRLSGMLFAGLLPRFKSVRETILKLEPAEQ